MMHVSYADENVLSDSNDFGFGSIARDMINNFTIIGNWNVKHNVKWSEFFKF